MKKYLVGLLLFAGLSGSAFCDVKPKQYGVFYPPDPSSFVSEGVYITSNTCADNSTNGSAVIISSRPVILYGVFVTNPGSADGSYQVFDSKTSTTGARAVTPPIDTSSKVPWVFNVGTSSGATVRNSGGTPACVAAIYLER